MTDEVPITYYKDTDVGKVRDHNEDWAAIEDPAEPEKKRKGRLFIVADGMGGYQAGEVASRLAADTVGREYYADPSDDPSARLRNAVQVANSEVHRQAQGNVARAGMGTTVVAAALIGRKAYIASVGDSRAYVVQKGAINQITQDHSFVGEQVRAGILTKEQARSHPQRNVITRALGSQPTVQVDMFVGELADGDVLVMCTDGLTGHVTDERIRDAVTHLPPDQAVRQLIQMAKDDGGSDNITSIVLRAGPPVSGRIQAVAPVPSLYTDATAVAAVPAAAPARPVAAPPPASPVPATRPAKKRGFGLAWVIAGVAIGVIVAGIGGVMVMRSGALRNILQRTPIATPATSSPQGTPATPGGAPVPPTLAPGMPTSTLAPVPPTPTPTRPRPIITPIVGATESPTPEVSPMPTPTETPQPDKGGHGGGGDGGGEKP